MEATKKTWLTPEQKAARKAAYQAKKAKAATKASPVAKQTTTDEQLAKVEKNRQALETVANGDSKPEPETKGEAELEKKKPAMLTDEANDWRSAFLAKAFAESRKNGRRASSVARFQAIEQAFADRPDNSVETEELEKHVTEALAALPETAGADQFTRDAFRTIVSRFGPEMQAAVRKVFDGQVAVTREQINESWNAIQMTWAGLHLESGTDRRRGLQIDADAPVVCQSSDDCTRSFVPFEWLMYNRDLGRNEPTGHIFVTKDGEKKWYCGECRRDGEHYGAKFFSQRSAQRIAGRARSDHDRREGVRASIAEAIVFKLSNRGEHRRNPDPVEALTDEAFARANHNFHELMDTETVFHSRGKYAARFSWEVGSKDDKKETESFLFVEKRPGNSIRILDAGPGLRQYRGESYSLGGRDIPGRLFAAIMAAQKS